MDIGVLFFHVSMFDIFFLLKVFSVSWLLSPAYISLLTKFYFFVVAVCSFSVFTICCTLSWIRLILQFSDILDINIVFASIRVYGTHFIYFIYYYYSSKKHKSDKITQYFSSFSNWMCLSICLCSNALFFNLSCPFSSKTEGWLFKLISI